jgi:hypothetical protein
MKQIKTPFNTRKFSFFFFLFILNFIILLKPTKAATLLTDDFLGSTINSSKWVEYDSSAGGSGGSTGNVQQNGAVTITGNGSWGKNALKSINTFDRSSGDLIIEGDWTINNSCSVDTLLSVAVMYSPWTGGNAPGGGATIGLVSYGTSFRLWSGSAMSNLTGVTCTVGASQHFKLVIKQNGGADVYINGRATPNASLTAVQAPNTYNNNPIILQQQSNLVNPSITIDNILVSSSDVPLAPTNLVTTPAVGQMTLNWTTATSAGSNLIDYIVQYKLSSEPSVWTTFADGTSTTTTAVVSGLANGQSYDFRVSAVNGMGTSSSSIIATGTPALSTASAPQNLTASSHENAQSLLTWTSPLSDGGAAVTDYLIEYKLSSEPSVWTIVNDGTSIATSTRITNLSNDLNYDVRVSAINAAGTSSPSTVVSFTPGNFVFLDEFQGTTINVNKWREIDSAVGGNGGSAGRVQQNNHLTIIGNDIWDANGLESVIPFDRRRGDVEVNVLMNSTSCSSGSTMQFGYGDIDAVTGNGTAYFITKNNSSWLLYYYFNGVNQSGLGVAIPGVVCGDNQDVNIKLVAQETGGVAVYLDASNTAAVVLADGTFTNKPVWMQSKASSNATTYKFITVKGYMSGPDAPVELIASANNEEINLNWIATANNGSEIIDYIIEYKLVSELSNWNTFNDGVSTSTAAVVTGLTTGLAYNFRVSAVSSNNNGDVSAIVTATPVSGTPTVPTISSTYILGAPATNEVVLGVYAFNDINGDTEAISTYRWLRSDSLLGLYTPIVGATSIRYKITSSDLGKYLKFEVTPVATVSPAIGNAVSSLAIGPVTNVDFINHILLSGQSLAVGYGGTPVLSSSQPYSNKTLEGTEGLGVTFIPLTEANRETIRSSAANNLTALSENNSYQAVATLNALGNTAYSGLKKGSTVYSNGLTQISNVYNAANVLGKTDRVSGVMIIHGEADHQARTTASEYESYLVEWQNDYETDAKAITGQVDNVPLFTDQMVSYTGYNAATSVIPGAQLAAAENNPNSIFLIGPKYFLTYSDYAHLTNTSYRWLGEYYGKIMKKVIIDREQWRPLSPDSIVRSNNIIYANFHVPAGQLAFDNTLVSARANYGFEYSDSNSSATINSVEILDADTVKITLSGTPTGYSQRLRYAYTGTPGSAPGAQNSGSAAGNLRDTDNAPSLYGNTLYNWAVHFDKPITVVNDVSVPTVSSFSVQATSSSLTVNINSFTASDNVAVTGYALTESSTAPAINDVAWSTSAPSSHTFTSYGSKMIYAWAKDSANNISSSASASVEIYLATTFSFSGPATGNENIDSDYFSVTPDDLYTGNITITPSGSGSAGLNPIILNFINSSTTQTFLIHPTTAGLINLDSTNSNGLTNASRLSYSVSSVDDETAPDIISNNPISLPAAIGSGLSDISVPMNEVRSISPVTSNGVNILGYINSRVNFVAPESSSSWSDGGHSLFISDLNLATDIITLTISSKPQTISLKKGEGREVDLDGDKKNDILVSFVNTYINRAEITVKSLIKNDVSQLSPAATTTSVIKTNKFLFKNNLKLGSNSNDVRELQKYLNLHGYTVSKSGVGSKGKETLYFGQATKVALIKFQKANKIDPAIGIFGPVTRKKINS